MADLTKTMTARVWHDADAAADNLCSNSIADYNFDMAEKASEFRNLGSQQLNIPKGSILPENAVVTLTMPAELWEIVRIELVETLEFELEEGASDGEESLASLREAIRVLSD